MQSVIDRIMAKITVEEHTDCWVFTGGKSNTYGFISWAGGGRGYTHRIMYEHHRGKIPKSLQIDHLCRNRVCCNPSHLEAVTQRENIRRGDSPIAKQARRTHCIYGHPLFGENLYQYKNHRFCHTCVTRRNRARYTKNVPRGTPPPNVA